MNDQPNEPKLLEHDADGIRELDNLLPRWWVWLFYGCIAYAAGWEALIDTHTDQALQFVCEFAPRIDPETRLRVPRLLRRVADGSLEVPSVHLHHRLQTDTHGLDRSRHWLLDDGRGTVLELDVHAHPEPQVLAVCMAIAAIPSVARAPAIDAVRRALRRPGIHPHRWRVVRLVVVGYRHGWCLVSIA